MEESLGKRIQQKREQIGYTQTELAHKAGVTPAAVNQWERGKRKPSATSLGKIAIPLHTTTDWLVGIERSIAVDDIMKDPIAKKVLEGIGDLSDKDIHTIFTYTEFLKSRGKQ